MLSIGIDVVALLVAAAAIAIAIAIIARHCGMDRQSTDAMCYTSMATSFALIVAYCVICKVLEAVA